MLLILHLIVVIGTVLIVLYSDEQAFMWFRGKKDRLDAAIVNRLHVVVAGGLGIIIVTGGFLYARSPVAFLTSPVFLVKMAAVSALILNTYAIGRLSHLATSGPYAALNSKERILVFVSGGVSVAGWVIAGICGYILS